MSEVRMSEAQQRAVSALRSVSPSDVRAHEALWASDPVLSVRLRDAVVASLAGRADGPEAVSLAVLSVARHYGKTGSEAHAVALAVSLARQAVRTAGTVVGPVSLDSDDGAREAAMARPSMGRSPEAVVVGAPESSLACRMAEAVGALPEAVREAWAGIGSAWLRHESGPCPRCESGRRPTLATVRAHAAGTVSKSAAWQAACRADRETVRAVSEAVSGLRDMPEAPDMSGPAWDLVRALRASGLSGRGSARETTAVVVTTEPGAWETVPEAWRSVMPGPVGPIPEARQAVIGARASLAWEARETARRARARARRASEPRIPGWAFGPMPGPEALPSVPVPEAGTYAGETVRGSGSRRVFRPSGPAVSEAFPMLRTEPGEAPESGAVVTVRSPDGAVRVRSMTEAETEALRTPRETTEVNGETVPVVRAPYAGESARDRSGTAPHGASWRRAGEPDGQVLSGARPVSPRKRAGSGATGPTVPDNGPLR